MQSCANTMRLGKCVPVISVCMFSALLCKGYHIDNNCDKIDLYSIKSYFIRHTLHDEIYFNNDIINLPIHLYNITYIYSLNTFFYFTEKLIRRVLMPFYSKQYK